MSSKLRTGICINCQNTFTSYNIGQETCSKQCAGAIRAKAALVECTCKNCGKVFQLRRCNVAEGRGLYCSIKCSSEDRKKTFDTALALERWTAGDSVPAVARAVGTTKHIIERWIKSLGLYEPRHAKGDQVHTWKGGVKITAKHYTQVRAIAGNACERCSYDACPDILEVHHKDRNRKNNRLENLELLCPNCHAIEHLETGSGLYTHHSRLAS